MRIISGKSRGAIIAAPPGARTRPTADRVREAVFSSLGSVEGLTVLDLFAGSGALALEALSRGAARAQMVENRAAAVRTIARNITKLGFENAALSRRDYLAFLKDAAKKQLRFDLIFVDPPYRMHRVVGPELKARLPAVLAPDGRVVIEFDARQDVDLPFRLIAAKLYGDTRIRIYRAEEQENSRVDL